jgi:hypothetical protein
MISFDLVNKTVNLLLLSILTVCERCSLGPDVFKGCYFSSIQVNLILNIDNIKGLSQSLDVIVLF